MGHDGTINFRFLLAWYFSPRHAMYETIVAGNFDAAWQGRQRREENGVRFIFLPQALDAQIG